MLEALEGLHSLEKHEAEIGAQVSSRKGPQEETWLVAGLGGKLC